MCQTTTTKHRAHFEPMFNDWSIPEEVDESCCDGSMTDGERLRQKIIVPTAIAMTTIVPHLYRFGLSPDPASMDDTTSSRTLRWVIAVLILLVWHHKIWNFVRKVSATVSEKMQFPTSRLTRSQMSVSMDQIESLRRTVSRNSMDAAKRLTLAARESSAHLLNDAVKMSWPPWSEHASSPCCHVMSLSAKEPFVSLDLISRMTLRDLSALFQDALDNRVKSNVLQDTPLLKQVKDATEAAICSSRGMDVVPTEARGATAAADMDAFAFCAIVRLFAEWRMVRQVPEGYRAYAAGMKMGRHDLIQNIAKIEKAAHNWIDFQRESANSGSDDESTSLVVVKSPSLRQLLEHELDHDMHPRLPKLSNNTAAMSLLWTLRQLKYQRVTSANMLEVPSTFADSSAAATAAYEEVYSSYHGWMIQKVFHHSLQSTPPGDLLYMLMNPQLFKELQTQPSRPRKQDLFLPVLQESPGSSFCSEEDSPLTWDDLDQAYESEGNDQLNICTLGFVLAEKWDEAGKNIQGGWENLVRSTVELFKNKAREEEERQKKLRDQYKRRFKADLAHYQFYPKKIAFEELRRPESPVRQEPQYLEDDEASLSPIAIAPVTVHHNTFVAEEMKNEAYRQIKEHLEVTGPVLRDLLELMEALNMNDPTKA